MEYLITALALLTTIVMHELGHGYVALWAGDDTAKQAGRLTLNPIKHIDPLGMLSLYILKIGWAKPVPINPYKFKRKKLDMIFVSIAGVTVNVLLATLAAFFILKTDVSQYLNDFFGLLFIYNVSFAVFNMLPIPPLDGSRILMQFLPRKAEWMAYKYERYSYILLLALSFSGLLSKILRPLIHGLSLWIIHLVV